MKGECETNQGRVTRFHELATGKAKDNTKSDRKKFSILSTLKKNTKIPTPGWMITRSLSRPLGYGPEFYEDIL